MVGTVEHPAGAKDHPGPGQATPPDLQDPAVKLVLEQAETLCKDWTGE